MASVLDQHYFKVVPKAVISSVVGGAGNTITITGTGLALLTSHHRLNIGLAVTPDIDINTTAIGAAGVDEVQSVTVDATAGDWTITYDGEETALLAFDISAANLELALEALPNVGVGNVSVSGGPGDAGGTSPYLVTFISALGWQDLPQVTTDATGLTGGASTAVVATLTPGQGGVKETQTLDITHATGGTFTVTYDGETTGNISLSATPAAFELALEALSNVGVGDINVSGAAGAWVLEFDNALAWTDVDEITVDGALLTVAPSLTLTSASAELTTNTATSLVVDLSDYEGEDVTTVNRSLPGVFSVSFDVDPDITLAP